MGQRQSAALVDAVTGGKPLPPEVLAEILRKTDGTPLFVKELTKTVIGSGLLKESPSGFVLQGALSALAIPSTLQDSLMARLDRLAGAKDVAQAGAAIGREFSHRLFAAVTAMSSAALDAGLDELVRAELVFRRGKPPDATYEFKNALVRDAAYQGMVRSQRALRHGLIAEAIRKFEPGTSAAQPELLAYRCQEAGQDEQAIGLWTQAGELATGR
jgi:predicted ATPase